MRRRFEKGKSPKGKRTSKIAGRDHHRKAVPRADLADVFMRTIPVPALRVDNNGTLTGANGKGRYMLRALDWSIGHKIPEPMASNIPGILLSGSARTETIVTQGKALHIVVTTMDDNMVRLLHRGEAANRVFVLATRNGTESPALRLLPIALYTWSRDTRTKISWMSRGVEELTGFPPSRFTSSAAFRRSRMHPDDRRAVARELANLKLTGHASMEYRFRCADDVYRWIAERMELPPGTATIYGMIQAADARKKEELALRESNGFLKTLLDSVEYGMTVLDANLRPVYANPSICQRVGYSVDELVGECRPLRFHPDDSPGCQKTLRDAIAGIPASCTARLRKRSGIWDSVRLSMSPLPWKDGILALCTVNDAEDAESAVAMSQDSPATVHETPLGDVVALQAAGVRDKGLLAEIGPPPRGKGDIHALNSGPI